MKSIYEKQQMVIDSFERINRQSRYEEKYGKDNLTVSEKMIEECQKRRRENKNKENEEKPKFSSKYIYQFVKYHNK